MCPIKNSQCHPQCNRPIKQIHLFVYYTILCGRLALPRHTFMLELLTEQSEIRRRYFIMSERLERFVCHGCKTQTFGKIQ